MDKDLAVRQDTAQSILWANPSAYDKKKDGDPASSAFGVIPINDGQRPEDMQRQRKTKRKRREGQERRFQLRMGTWNVGSMTGKGRELVDVMMRRRVKVLCVQETRWKGSGTREMGEGFKLFFTGESGRNGVGIILDEEYKKKVIEVDRKSERLMRIKMVIGKLIVNVVSGYAPPVGCSDEEKRDFEESLEEVLRNVRSEDMLILGGDLNGHVGKTAEGSEEVHGGKGFGERNEAGEKIIEIAIAFDLKIMNTWFLKKVEHLITFKSGGNCSQIDYFLMSKKDSRLVQDCKVIVGEAAVRQHRLLVMDIKVQDRPPRENKKFRSRLKIWELKGENVNKFQREVLERMKGRKLNGEVGVNEEWDDFVNIVKGAAEQICGKIREGKRLWRETWWWNEEVKEAVRKKKEAFRVWQKGDNQEDREKYKECNRTVKRAVRIAKEREWEKWYEKLETKEGEKTIYKIARNRASARRDILEINALKGENGELLIQAERILHRWKEYFQNLLNEENERGVLINVEVNLSPVEDITRAEVNRALETMKNGKAAGPSGVVVEMLKALALEGKQWLFNIMKRVWVSEKIPEGWKRSDMVPIYKQRGDPLQCNNYRGIKLLEHAFKVLEKVVESRVRGKLEIDERQFGFMKGRSAIDAIFIARQIQEKRLEGNQGVFYACLDLEKAYDRVPKEVVFWCLRRKGVPEKLVRLVEEMYKGAWTAIRTPNGRSEEFEVGVGLHQGSALSPLLFITVMDELSKTIGRQGLWELLYADDIMLIANSEEELQQGLRDWQGCLENGGMKLNINKTEVLASVKNQKVNLKLTDRNGLDITQKAKVKYLGVMIDEKGGCTVEVKSRISKGWLKWRELTGVLCDAKMPRKLKIKIYEAIIRPVLLYGSETWTLRKTEELMLARTEMRMLRWLSGISLRERRRSEEIRRELGVECILDRITKSQLRWVRHMLRRGEDDMARRAFDLRVEGKRSRGRQRKRWVDVVEEDMKMVGLEKGDALDREKWQRKIQEAYPCKGTKAAK